MTAQGRVSLSSANGYPIAITADLNNARLARSDALGGALKKAIYNYMHGIGLEEDVRAWFAEYLPGRVPRPTVGRQRIARALVQTPPRSARV